MIAGTLLLAALVPVIEEFNIASFVILVLSLGIGLRLMTNNETPGFGEHAAALFNLYLVGPFRFFRDFISAFNLPALKSRFSVWLIPVSLSGIFLFLLASENPCSRSGSA